MTRRDLRRRLEQLEETDYQPDLETSISRTLIVSRKRAEREERGILGLAETPDDIDYVVVGP